MWSGSVATEGFFFENVKIKVMVYCQTCCHGSRPCLGAPNTEATRGILGGVRGVWPSALPFSEVWNSSGRTRVVLGESSVSKDWGGQVRAQGDRATKRPKVGVVGLGTLMWTEPGPCVIVNNPSPRCGHFLGPLNGCRQQMRHHKDHHESLSPKQLRWHPVCSSPSRLLRVFGSQHNLTTNAWPYLQLLKNPFDPAFGSLLGAQFWNWMHSRCSFRLPRKEERRAGRPVGQPALGNQRSCTRTASTLIWFSWLCVEQYKCNVFKRCIKDTIGKIPSPRNLGLS